MEQIVVTGMGCVFADSIGVDRFWQNILSEKRLQRPVSEGRWDNIPTPFRLRLNQSYLTAFVSADDLKDLAIKNGLDLSQSTRLEIFVQDSCRQAVSNPESFKDRRGGLILGAMNPDDEYNLSLGQFFDRELLAAAHKDLDRQTNPALETFERLILDAHETRYDRQDRYVTSLITDQVSKRFGFSEASILVDAACASSLASLDIGYLLVSLGIWDYALIGGVETNLSPGSFRTFEAVGALASKGCRPFDASTDGLMQGEGCGVLLIERESDAQQRHADIHAYVRSVAGSSDGRTTSLFQPSSIGQSLSYQRAHSSLNERVDYIEAHGTGTVTGDRTEIESLSKFLNGRKIPVSSVKGQFGHTKGAAGAAGLIKSIQMMKSQSLPPVSYIRNPLSEDVLLQLSSKKIEGRLNCSGVSSFGFGGSNFHAVLSQSPLPHRSDKESDPSIQESVYLVSQTEAALANFDPQIFCSENHFYRLPPKSLENIDPAQLLALDCAIRAIGALGRDLELIPSQDVVVLSASILGLTEVSLMAKRLKLEVYQALIQEELASQKGQTALLSWLNRYQTSVPEIGEDFSTGVLNNVIAGRVCHAFDFRGPSYNIECGLDSEAVAERILYEKIRTGQAPMGVLVSLQEELTTSGDPVRRLGACAKVFMSDTWVRRLLLKPLSQVEAL